MRNSNQLLHDLIHLNADEWNRRMSDDIGINVESLKSNLSMRDTLTCSEDRLHVSIKKAYLNDDVKIDTSPNGDKINIVSKISKYVLRKNDSGRIIQSVACTGKIIVGLDFSDSDISSSYFCDCLFYNCDFSKANLQSSVFNGCVINNCNFHDSDMTLSYIIRSSIIDTVFNQSILDNVVVSDTMFIGIQGIDVRASDIRLSGSGFVQCNFNNSLMPGSFWVMVSTVMSEFRDIDFAESSFIDCILTSSDLRGCDFDKSSFTCITSSRNKVDSTFSNLMDNDLPIRSQAEHEWIDHKADDSIGGLDDTFVG